MIEKFQLSLFSAVIVRPVRNKDVAVTAEIGKANVSYQKSLGSKEIEIPEGRDAVVKVGEYEAEISDYRERDGHTPGARVKAGDIDEKLDPENSSVYIPGFGDIEYKKA